MESRERNLLLVFVAVLMVGGYFYSGMIISSVKGLLGLSSPGTPAQQTKQPQEQTKSEPEIDNSELLSSALEFYRQRLNRGLGDVALNWEAISQSKGLQGAFDFRLEPSPERDLETLLQGQFNGSLTDSGMVHGSVRLDTPSSLQGEEWTVATSDGFFLSGLPEGNVQLPLPFRGESSSVGLFLYDWSSASVSSRKSIRWNNREVYSLTLDGDQKRTLYVTRNTPHRLVGISWSDGSKWTREIQYQAGNDSALASIRRLQSGDSLREVDFESAGNFTLRKWSSQGGLSAVQFIVSANEDEWDVAIEAKYTSQGDYRGIGQSTLIFRDGLPDQLSLELSLVNDESTDLAQVSLESTEVKLLEEVVSETVDNQESYTAISLADFMGRIKEFGPSGTTNRSGTPPSGSVRTDGEMSADDSMRPVPAKPESPTADKPKDRKSGNYTGPIPDAPEGSGETVVISASGYPSAVPPEGFKQAQKALNNGRLMQALSLLKSLEDTYPKSINVTYTLGLVNYKLGEYAAAYRAFKKTITLGHDPQLSGWSHQYLRMLERLTETAE
jgi:hypothetical protein